MKSYLIIFSVFASTFASAQLKGFEYYQVTNERSFDSDKQYIIGEEVYEHVLMDAVDGHISVLLFEAVFDEAERIFRENDLLIGKGTVLIDSDWVESDWLSIKTAIQEDYEFIMLRYELKDGYYLYLNLQDEFCATFVTKDLIE